MFVLVLQAAHQSMSHATMWLAQPLQNYDEEGVGGVATVKSVCHYCITEQYASFARNLQLRSPSGVSESISK